MVGDQHFHIFTCQVALQCLLYIRVGVSCSYVGAVGQKSNLEDSDEEEGDSGRKRHVEESESDGEGEAEVFRGQDVLRRRK